MADPSKVLDVSFSGLPQAEAAIPYGVHLRFKASLAALFIDGKHPLHMRAPINRGIECPRSRLCQRNTVKILLPVGLAQPKNKRQRFSDAFIETDAGNILVLLHNFEQWLYVNFSHELPIMLQVQRIRRVDLFVQAIHHMAQAPVAIREITVSKETGLKNKRTAFLIVDFGMIHVIIANKPANRNTPEIDSLVQVF